ncbi:hypothetical protein CCYA_CCYA15G4005 [Cyanidiococcus yangmingshanensis]|nr:hypothetical protein CCYA_CCYA15G4005 [Cyanidiococcus yangmingshanensis]
MDLWMRSKQSKYDLLQIDADECTQRGTSVRTRGRLAFGSVPSVLFTTVIAASMKGESSVVRSRVFGRRWFRCNGVQGHKDLGLGWRRAGSRPKPRSRGWLLTGTASKPDQEPDESDDDLDENDSEGSEPTPTRKPQHQVPESVIDWNQEWKAFVRDGKIDWSQLPRERPAPTVWRRRAAQVRQFWLQSRAKVPPWSVLSRDWRFWLALLLTLSVLSSAWTYSELTNPHTIPPGMRAILEGTLDWSVLV